MDWMINQSMGTAARLIAGGDEEAAKQTVVPRTLLAFGAGAGGDEEGDDAEDEGEGGHEDGPEAEAGGTEGGLERSLAGFPFLALHFGELDDEDGALGGETDEEDDADLGVDVIGPCPGS